MPINRTPILKTNWLGQSPYLIKRIVEPYAGKFKQKQPQQVVSEVPQEDQDWDLGTLPEVVITPEVVKESPIIAQETPTVVAEDPYQTSNEPYQEKQILTNWLLDNGQLNKHPSSQKEIETVYLDNDFYPIINSSDYSSLEIPDNIQETPVELNIPKETRVPKKVFTKDDMAKLLANYTTLAYN